MINYQGDRFEFRFFSPTFEEKKLNHYVRLAHHIYKRLAGKNCKLPRQTSDYFIKKMTTVNRISDDIAKMTIELTNNISPLDVLTENETSNENDA
jgi:hypothetical protein